MATPIFLNHRTILPSRKAVRYEKAVTLGDILLRRVRVALGRAGRRNAARKRRKDRLRVGWTLSRIDEELEEFEAERELSCIREAEARSPAY